MIDLKALDDDLHIALTGASNSRVLDTIRYLSDQRRLYEVRLPIIAGLNDTDDLLTRTAHWLHEIDPAMRIKVIGFRKHGVRPQHNSLVEPTAEQMDHYAQVLTAAGARDIVKV